jgi:hypothetical protein
MLGAAALVIIAGGLMIMAFWSTPLGMALGAAVFALGVTLSTQPGSDAPFVPSRVQTTRHSGRIAWDGARLRPRCDLRLLPDP